MCLGGGGSCSSLYDNRRKNRQPIESICSKTMLWLTKSIRWAYCKVKVRACSHPVSILICVYRGFASIAQFYVCASLQTVHAANSLNYFEQNQTNAARLFEMVGTKPLLFLSLQVASNVGLTAKRYNSVIYSINSTHKANRQQQKVQSHKLHQVQRTHSSLPCLK